MSNSILFRFGFLFVSLLIITRSLYAQECVTCYKSNGSPVNVGGPSWHESRNGDSYTCTCTSSGPRCVKSSSSQSGGGSSYSGNSNAQMMQSVLEPLLQNFFNSLFSSSDNSSSENNSSSEGNSSSSYTHTPSQEEIDAAIAKQKAWQEQVRKLRENFTQTVNEKFSDQQKVVANDLKNRQAKSEAVTATKQLNCAARKHITDALSVINGKVSLKDLDGQMEEMRSTADFTAAKVSDCPDIEVKVPEVTVTNPIGFQQMFYESIKNKADSITIHVALLKEQNINLKKTIEGKKCELEEIKQKSKAKDDKRLQEAYATLNEALEEEKKIDGEILNNQKNVEALEKIRSTYDIKQTQN